MKANVIRLLEGSGTITKDFKKGDTIHGNWSDPIELKRWRIEEKKEAIEELKKYKSTYKNEQAHEYALEFSEYDKEEDFVDGSDYEYAEEKEW